MNEFKIIQKYFKPLTKENQAANLLQDDVAKIDLGNKKELVVSKDLMIENVHFKKSDGGYQIACKLLKTNLSDLASSGAKPLYYMLGFCKNNDDEKFIKDFCQGLKDVGEEFKIDLIGGDSVKNSSNLCFSITIFGEIAKGKSLDRNRAKAGDLIFVSGTIGDAFLGLKISQNEIISNNKTHTKYLLNRHFQPSPRIKLGMELVKQNLSYCAIDISDGFLADLKHICEASNLDAIVNQAQIPLSQSAKFFLKNNPINLSDLFSGGDDYELIFTSDPKNKNKIERLSKRIGLGLTCVGELKSTKTKPKIQLLDSKQNPIKILKFGYVH